jgi:hypothetical protein
VLFCPNGLAVKSTSTSGTGGESNDTQNAAKATPLGQGYLIVRSRLRVTRDGGHSLLAVQDANHMTRLHRISGKSTPAMTTTPYLGNVPTASSTPFVTLPSVPPSQLDFATPASDPGLASSSTSTIPQSQFGVATPYSGLTASSSAIPLARTSALTPVSYTTSSSSQLAQRSTTISQPLNHKYNLRPAQPPQSIQQTKIDPHSTTSTANDSSFASMRQDSFAPVRLFLLREAAQGHARVPYLKILRDLVGLETGRPFQTAEALTQAISAAASRGDVTSVDQNGSLWLSLPSSQSMASSSQSPITTPHSSTPQESYHQTHLPAHSFQSNPRDMDAESGSDSDKDSADIVLDSAFRPVEEDFAPVLQLLAQTHADGYPSVGFTWLHKKLKRMVPFRKKAQFKAAITSASSARELIMFQDVKGIWLSLPPTSAYRIPSRVHPRVRPQEGEPGEMDRLLAFLGKAQRTSRSVRKHFKNNEPDTPYGQTPNAIKAAVERARMMGLVVCGGQGKKAWVKAC